MTALGLGAAWAVLAGCWAATAIGRRVVRRRTVPPPARTPAPRVPLPRATARRIALVAAAGLLLWLHPILAMGAGVAFLAAPRWRQRRAARWRRAAVVDELPDVVDLIGLTTASGLPVGTAIRAIGSRPGGQIGAALETAAARLANGGTTSDALDSLLMRCGTPLRRLVDALRDHDRYGTPLGPVLDRVAVETRLARRRQAEEAARRLPVTLLFPLVLTVLPAFVLLVVAPLLAGSFSTLDL